MFRYVNSKNIVHTFYVELTRIVVRFFAKRSIIIFFVLVKKTSLKYYITFLEQRNNYRFKKHTNMEITARLL